MDVVIIEDERLSADKLIRMIATYDPDIQIIGNIDSVKRGIEWFKENSPPDLVFLDIQLSDGTGFDLLRQISHSPPVIYTTAYDQYAIKAFKYNSIDYLLKPLNQKELETAIEKFRKIDTSERRTENDLNTVDKLINGDFKKRFLVRVGEQFQSVDIHQVAYFRYDDGLAYIHCLDGRKLPIDQSLDNLENMLHPLEFFRINRKMIIGLTSIHQIHTYFNSRLLLKLKPDSTEEVIVSRDRVSDFKRWMDV